jgi:hypothetical protein
LPCSFVFQPRYVGGSLNFDRSSPPANMSNSVIPSAPHYPCRCAKHLSRISDLEGRLSLLKSQAKTAVDQAGKSFGLMKQVSSLENQVSNLMARSFTSRNVILCLLKLSNRPASNCNVSFLEAPLCFFAFDRGIDNRACQLSTPEAR